MRKLYGSAEKFLATFNPALQLTAARHLDRAYRGTAPQLATVCAGYGEPVAVVWLCIQIENVNLFAGVKEKMPVERQKELAGLILTEYAYLKTTELLLFFHRLKCGRYGRFYGTVDALFIASALLQFLDERRKDLAGLLTDDERRQKSAAASSAPSRPASSTCITYEEYLLWKRCQQERGKKGATGPQGATGPTGGAGPKRAVDPQGGGGPKGATGPKKTEDKKGDPVLSADRLRPVPLPSVQSPIDGFPETPDEALHDFFIK